MRIALRQVVERRVAGVAGVAMFARPAAAGRVVLRQRADRMGQFAEQLVVGELRFIQLGDEEGPNGHLDAVRRGAASAQGRGQGRGGYLASLRSGRVFHARLSVCVIDFACAC